MAVQTTPQTVTLIASANFSALTMGRFVEFLSAAGLTLCRDTQRADGVLNTFPAASFAAAVIVGAGKVRVESGAAVTVGALVASDISGRAVPSTVYAGEVILGRALSAAGAAGEEITILYFGNGGGGTD